MPLSGNLASINLADNMTYALNRSLDLESATVGLFTTTLHNGIKIEITSGNHTGFMKGFRTIVPLPMFTPRWQELKRSTSTMRMYL
jgi:hypothetical protein